MYSLKRVARHEFDLNLEIGMREHPIDLAQWRFADLRLDLDMILTGVVEIGQRAIAFVLASEEVVQACARTPLLGVVTPP
jgi:hypothetical protein